jgi:hypothetical protein
VSRSPGGPPHYHLHGCRIYGVRVLFVRCLVRSQSVCQSAIRSPTAIRASGFGTLLPRNGSVIEHLTPHTAKIVRETLCLLVVTHQGLPVCVIRSVLSCARWPVRGGAAIFVEVFTQLERERTIREIGQISPPVLIKFILIGDPYNTQSWSKCNTPQRTTKQNRMDA